MRNSYLEHPAEEVLERFLLHHSDDEEVETVETHILACESCVTRLETLEVEIAATKLALQNIRVQEAEKSVAKQPVAARSWFSLPRLSMAAGLAVLAVGVAILPTISHRTADVAQVDFVAYRGVESPVVPENKPLHVRLNASDLAQNSVKVELVNASGTQLWGGSSPVQHNEVEVSVPKIGDAGTHYFRIYSNSGELLREFSFQVK